MTAYSTVSDVLIKIESTFIEDGPWSVHFVPYLEQQIEILDPRFEDLPQAFVDALSDLLRHQDAVACARCDTLTGYVLVERAGFERIEWRPTGLARLADGPVVPLCESCTPYVPTEPEVSK